MGWTTGPDGQPQWTDDKPSASPTGGEDPSQHEGTVPMHRGQDSDFGDDSGGQWYGGVQPAVPGGATGVDGYSVDALTRYKNSAPWMGPSGQGYYDPTTGQESNQWTSSSMPLDRPGIDNRLQGNLENPYAGYYGGAPGAAESEEGRYAGLAQAARFQKGAQIDNTQYNQDRGLEMGSRGAQGAGLAGYGQVFGQYANMAAGNGPSVAQQQMQRGLAASNQQQASIAASARGGGANLAAAQQAASNAAATASGNIVGQEGVARATEQLGAMQGELGALGGYGGLASQQRAGDLQRQGLSGQNAYEQAQLDQSQHALNNQAALGYEGMRQNVFGQQQQGMEYNESENQNAFMGGQGLDVQRSAQNSATTNAAVGGIASTVAAVAPIALAALDQKGTPSGTGANGWVPQGWNSSSGSTPGQTGQQGQVTPGSKSMSGDVPSDERLKTRITPGAREVGDQLAMTQPATFDYRDPAMGEGRRVGVIAQNVERGPLGLALVKETPKGKAIDGKNAIGLALAGAANHEQRLRAMEAKAGGADVKEETRPMTERGMSPIEREEYARVMDRSRAGQTTPADARALAVWRSGADSNGMPAAAAAPAPSSAPYVRGIAAVPSGAKASPMAGDAQQWLARATAHAPPPQSSTPPWLAQAQPATFAAQVAAVPHQQAADQAATYYARALEARYKDEREAAILARARGEMLAGRGSVPGGG